MRKLLNKPWFVAMLALAAVVFVAKSLHDQRRAHAWASSAGEPFESTAEDFAEDTVDVEPASSATLVDALKSLSLADRLPNPFEPRRPRAEDNGETQERLPDFTESVRLTALWQQEEERLAHVNGRIVRAGETLGRITLESFEREGIWLTHWKGRDFLRLGQEFTLITPAAKAANLETAEDEP